MKRTFSVTVDVEVYDEEALKEASLRRALEDGIGIEDWRESQAAGGAAYDLQMLIDPGSMFEAGSSILGSSGEEITT